MKKTLLIAAALLAPALANAGWGVSVRSDYVNVMEDKLGVTMGKGSSTFMPSYGVLNGSGKVGDADVHAKFDLLAGGGNYTATSFVEHLYMSKAINDSWTFSAGKLVSPVGGYEAEMIKNGDDYLASMANGGTTALTGTVVTSVGNNSGFGATWAGGDHKVAFQAFNGSAAGAAVTKRHAMGVSYWGAFGDHGLRFAYYSAPAGGASDANNTYMNLGFAGKWGETGLWFDYLMNSQKIGSADADSTSSIVLNAKHNMGDMTPVLKYEMSTLDDKNTPSKGTRTGITLGLEMKPSDDAFRYHVMYSMLSEKPEGGSSNSASMLTAGIKYDADFLK